MSDHQQVLIPVSDIPVRSETISIVSLNGNTEIAILGPDGVVYHDTVTPIEDGRQLSLFLKKWFEGDIDS